MDLARAPFRPHASPRRTTPREQVEKRTEGLSVFLVDLKGRPEARYPPDSDDDEPREDGVFFDGVELPGDALVGEEGKGFRYILDAMNAERILLASERIGDGRWFVARPRVTPPNASSSGGRSEYDVERKFRETRLYSMAPVSNNLVLAYLGQHVLGMPRSY